MIAITALASSLLLVAGCGPQGTSTGTTVGQKMDRAADKVADTTANASAKVATAADDTAITAKVKAALIAEPGLKSTAIDVDTKDATVTLSGTVASNELRDRAKQIASSTNGVKNVVDNLIVKSA
ncbi:MAG TPA: BON domain-containing protein [Casimicrobiaceae bacterium]|jgi:osmotically-inducible protein OsmY|nr:BON domain-containing protein [Casimicrobiaceae bacterium]